MSFWLPWDMVQSPIQTSSDIHKQPTVQNSMAVWAVFTEPMPALFSVLFPKVYENLCQEALWSSPWFCLQLTSPWPKGQYWYLFSLWRKLPKPGSAHPGPLLLTSLMPVAQQQTHTPSTRAWNGR